jgi:ABC-type amino acid transport substrate-binding protein
MAISPRWLVTIAWLLLMAVPATIHARMLLDTNLSPPYQIERDGQLAGTAVLTLDCVFAAVGMPYEIRVVPWRRGHFNLQNGLSEGLFSVMPVAEMDRYATLSAPLALEKWHWFALSEQVLTKADFPAAYRIGAVLGSNQSSWLAARGVRIAEEVAAVSQLVTLVETGRIDAFLADIHTINDYLGSRANRPLIYSQFQRYTPLGVYFSHRFLQTRLGFLERFNAAVSLCNRETVQLDTAEQMQLRRLIETKVMGWSHADKLVTALREANRVRQNITPADIQRLDHQWMSEFSSGQHELIRSVIEHPLSAFLRDIHQADKDLYSEILVMDRLGLNVGVSQITSDYWQGDESKYQQVFPPGGEPIFIDRIEYDHSTRKFQVQVSIRIVDPDSSLPIGVLTVGIDVEGMLQN